MVKFQSAILIILLAPIASISYAAQTPAATTVAATRVSAAEQEKRLTKRVNPKYPKEAFDAKLTGIITLETIIGTDGKVTSVRLIGKGEDLLVKSAMDAVKQWLYKPYKVDGKPVAVMTMVTINFKVGEQ
jgi:TonB family protein